MGGGGSGQRLAPAALYLRGKDLGSHWTEGWVVLRVGLDTEARGKILCLCPGSQTPVAWLPSLWSDLILIELPQLWQRSEHAQRRVV
jgi:hypothetical protein